jgi:hypothetical protein
MTPDELAAELGYSGRTIRAWLRTHRPRVGSAKGSRWDLTSEDCAAVREAFASRESTSTPPIYPPRDQLVVMADEMRTRLGVQLAELDGLDAKATTVLAAAGVVLGLATGAAKDLATAVAPAPLLFYGALVVLGIDLVLGVWALWPRKAKVVPEPGPFVDGYYSKTADETMAALIVARRDAYEQNVSLTSDKGDRVRVQMVLLAVGGLALISAYLVQRIM